MAFPYVKLAERLSDVGVGDMYDTKWFLGGRDVESTAGLPSAVIAFIDKMIAEGKIVQATQSEWNAANPVAEPVVPEDVASINEAIKGLNAVKPITALTLSKKLPVRDIREWTDGAFSVRSGVQAAIDELSNRAFPGGTLVVPEGVSLNINAPVFLRGALITLQGEGSSSVITSTSSIASAAIVNDPTLDLPGFHISGVRFVGGVVDPGQGSGPLRGRTTSASFSSAIKLEGWSTAMPGRKNIYDISVTDCEFINVAGLPFFFDGVRELARVERNLFRNTLDPGFVGVDEVQFNDNTTQRGADNGVSVSRGCRRITIANNLMIECAYSGVWVSGWVTEEGPEILSVTGNTIERCGTHGIRVVDGVHTGTISGNTVKDVYRGPTDILNDSSGCGIRLGNDVADQTVSNINVSSNTFENCRRGGVLVSARVSDCVVQNNLIINPGVATLNDGTTVITNSYESSNFGVLVEAAATRVDIRGNTMIDNRGTKLANHPIVGLINTSGAASGNTAYGFRHPLVETVPAGGIALGSVGWISTPPHPRLDVVGDISGVLDIAVPDWSPAADGTIASRYLPAGNKRSWRLTLTTTGTIVFTWTTDGISFNDISTNANLSALAANLRRFIWFEFDVDNGASGRALRVFTSPDAITWTQLGTTTTQAGVTSIFAGGASGAALELGAYASVNGGSPTSPLAGTIYSASIRSGISGTSTPGGTEIAAWELESISNRRKDRYGNIWTVRGTTPAYANPVSTAI